MERRTDPSESGHVEGMPRAFLRAEAIAALAGGVWLWFAHGGELFWLVPFILAVDISISGYLAGPRVGAVVYNLAHNWALGLAVLGIGVWTASTPLVLGGAVLIAHVGMDRTLGYGLKYPSSFSETHLGRIGRRRDASA